MKLATRVIGTTLAMLLAGAGLASAEPANATVKTPQAIRHFQNVRFQKCLDADTNGGGNGTAVQLWDCGPWNQQWWVLRSDGSIYNQRFQKCLDADTNDGGNGTRVQLWDCGPWNQQWWT